MQTRSRFAPSTTGPAHPGTLLAALLWWLDGRSAGHELWLRFEDNDPQRCKPHFVERLRHDLQWFGLDWDHEQLQSDHRVHHQAAFDMLREQHLVYACDCSRRRLSTLDKGLDGAPLYDHHCRSRQDEFINIDSSELSIQDVRNNTLPLAWRLSLPDGVVSWHEGDSENNARPDSWNVSIPEQLSDPIIWRRDGAPAYHLAAVVDDAQAGITHIVRGADLRWATPIHLQLQAMLGYPSPCYQHHALLFESAISTELGTSSGKAGQKLSKSHGAIGLAELQGAYQATELCGLLAAMVGLLDRAEPCSPTDLIELFTWDKVTTTDQVIAWDDNHKQLHHLGPRS